MTAIVAAVLIVSTVAYAMGISSPAAHAQRAARVGSAAARYSIAYGGKAVKA